MIAGEERRIRATGLRVDRLTRQFQRAVHYTVDEHGETSALTDTGIRAVEEAFGMRQSVRRSKPALYTAVQDSLHAHALLRRDVDYIVKNGAIESVDEFKGRIAQDRRWPAGLHTAIEAKEGVAAEDPDACWVP